MKLTSVKILLFAILLVLVGMAEIFGTVSSLLVIVGLLLGALGLIFKEPEDSE